MNMKDYFNPNNPKHIEAYLYLCDHAEWPKDFIPVTVDPLTTYVEINDIRLKMAHCWVEHIRKLHG